MPVYYEGADYQQASTSGIWQICSCLVVEIETVKLEIDRGIFAEAYHSSNLQKIKFSLLFVRLLSQKYNIGFTCHSLQKMKSVHAYIHAGISIKLCLE